MFGSDGSGSCSGLPMVEIQGPTQRRGPFFVLLFPADKRFHNHTTPHTGYRIASRGIARRGGDNQVESSCAYTGQTRRGKMNSLRKKLGGLIPSDVSPPACAASKGER